MLLTYKLRPFRYAPFAVAKLSELQHAAGLAVRDGSVAALSEKMHQNKVILHSTLQNVSYCAVMDFHFTLREE